MRRTRHVPPFQLLAFLFCCLLLWNSGQAQTPGSAPPGGRQQQGLPADLREVGIDQRLDQPLPLELEFRDETGATVKLGKYFGGRPVILTLVYYHCPMLCAHALNGMIGALRALPFDAGDQFEVVTVSFDPSETPQSARIKKDAVLRRYGRAGAERGWHFLTADQASIDGLTRAVGFRYKFLAATGQFAHSSAIFVVTPQGRLSRYFYGIEYSPRDLRLGLVEASAGKIGSPVDQLLLYCYHYDPMTGKYGAVIMNFVRLAAGLSVAGLVVLVLMLRSRQPAAGSRQ
ncbi:MAG: SCO family protein [Acidobacteriota bacterium]